MKLFDSISVKWKIYSIVIVSLIGFACYLGFNVIVNTDNSELLAKVRDKYFPMLELAKENRNKINHINEQFNTAVLISDTDFVDDTEEMVEEFFADMDRSIMLSPKDEVAIKKIKKEFQSFFKQAYEISYGMIEEEIDFTELTYLAAEKTETLKRVTKGQDAYIQHVLEQFKGGIRQANENSKTLLKLGFILWFVNVIVLVATAVAIARLILTNIVSVSTSLEEIAKGEGDLDQEIAVRSKDEIGQLAVSFNNLMARLRERTNDLMNMMQNMHQGLFTVMAKDDQLIIHPEYAAYVEDIFETKGIAGMNYSDLLFSNAEIGSNELDQILTSVSSIIKEDAMMFEFNSHLLPSEIIVNFPDRRTSNRMDVSDEPGRIKILELDWDPIIAEDMVDKIMVTVRDVTELRAAAKEAEAQKEELEIIGQILHVSTEKFDVFVKSANSLMANNKKLIQDNEVKNLEVVADLFVNMHTIKGNTRTYGFSYITDLVHDAETSYDTLRKDESFLWDQTQLLCELDGVKQGIDRYAQIKNEKLSFGTDVTSAADIIAMSKGAYGELLEDCNSLTQLDVGAQSNEYILRLTKAIRKIDTRPLSQMISGVIESLPSIAKQLDKAPPILDIEDGNVGIKNEHGEMIVNVFTHLLRNSIDHGIETREGRNQCGKDAQGTVSIKLIPNAEVVRISIEDDGRGLALSRIKAKALETNPNALSADGSAQGVANLLFESGVTTAEKLSDVSGRGVGMDAVRKFLQSNGANVEVVLIGSPSADDDFAPFKMVLTLPNQMVEF